jgi:guanine nucleotide-binding protein subunit alpha
MTGSGESGKSTIVKQMKIIHQDGYSTDELLSWRLCVYKNLIESAKDLITATEKIQVQFENPHNKVSGRENFCLMHLMSWLPKDADKIYGKQRRA